MNENTLENKAVYYSKLFSRITGLTIIVVSIIVLSGELLDIQVIKHLFPNLLTMKITISLLLLITGISLWFSIADTSKDMALIVARACAVAVALAGIITLSGYIFHTNIGIDPVLLKRTIGSVTARKPGHMAYTTAFNFFLIGLSLLMINVKDGSVSQILASIVGIISFFNFTCYVYSVTTLMDIPESMSLNISLTFIVLCVGVIFARPNGLIASVITSNSPGGYSARRLLPIAIIIPLMLGWLRLKWELIGLYDSPFRTALVIGLVTIIFSFLIWLSSMLLNKSDRELQSLKELSSKLIAHDLKNPLSAITGSLEILKNSEGTYTGEMQAKTIDNALKASKSLLNMINTMVDINKIRDGKMSLNLSIVPLDNLLNERISLYEQTAKSYGLVLRGNFKAKNITANIDNDLFGRVIDNLLTNALRHTHSGGRVTVGLEKADGRLRVYVEDTGEGIPAEYRKKIFEQYGAAEIKKKMGAHNGIGLGLVFCKLAVQLHGGTIRVESEVGKGSKFIVELPYTKQIMDIKITDVQVSANTTV